MNRLRELRDKTGLTLNDFAARLNANPATIIRWEKKDIPDARIDDICQEFSEFEITPEWLAPDRKVIADGIGARLQTVRGLLRLSLVEVAKRLGDVTPEAVGNWEKKNKIPEVRIPYIAEKLKINLDWLKTGEGEMFSATQAVQRAGTPKDLALIYGCDHRTAAFLERYVQLPDGERKQFNSTLAKLILDRQIQVDDSAKTIDEIQKEKPH